MTAIPRDPEVEPFPSKVADASSFSIGASAFRGERTERRRGRVGLAVEAVAVVVLLLGIYAIVTVGPPSTSGAESPVAPSGPPIVVRLGTPTVSSVVCGEGGAAFAERIPWSNSTQPLTTGEVEVRVYQIGDGDILGDGGVVANATPSKLCAGAPPSAEARWYGVLRNAEGTNLLTFTFAQGWRSVTDSSRDVPIANDSAIILVTAESLAGIGYGLKIVGYANSSPVQGSVPL